MKFCGNLFLKRHFIISLIFFLFWMNSITDKTLASIQLDQCDYTNQNTFDFRILSPTNSVIYEEKPIVQFYISPVNLSVIFLLNGTQLDNLKNNSKLPVYLRGKYNLTAVAYYNDNETIIQIFFSFIPKLSVTVANNSSYINKYLFIQGYNDSIPCYTFNETIQLYVYLNERNSTLDVKFNYTSSKDIYYLNENNFFWINESSFLLNIEPVAQNHTIHKLLFLITSSITHCLYKKTYYFYRDVFPPIIRPDQYENFISQPHSGIAIGHFYVEGNIIDLINVSVYLNDVLIQSYTEKNMDNFDGVLTIIIDTTKYKDGIYALTIFAEDFFHLSTKETYLLTFDNSVHTPPETNTGKVSIDFFIYTLGFVLITFIYKFLKRKIRSKS